MEQDYLHRRISRKHRKQKPNSKVMKSNAVPYSQEQTAVIDEWCRRYPNRGKGVDLKRIRAEDGGRLKQLMEATGRTEMQLYQKATYHRQNVIQDVPKKPSSLTAKDKLRTGHANYQCRICGEGFDKKQGLGAHMAAHYRKGEGKTNHVTKSWVSEGAPITVTIPPAIVGQPLGDYMIVELNGSHRLAKLV